MERKISIHALVKRATVKADSILNVNLISIHALVKRATADDAELRCYIENFNPRPREEGDVVQCLRQSRKDDSNPRPREEGDFPTFRPSTVQTQFQSTPS